MSSRLPTNLPPNAHPGLVFDRGFRNTSKEAKGKHIELVAKHWNPSAYSGFYTRWKAALEALQHGETGGGITKLASLKAEGRLAIGLGAESVVETSIALHKVYGVPYIPGSALKGVARRYARQALGDDWKEESRAFQTLFGKAGDDDSFRGVVVFHDALPRPGGYRLLPDTITVHHPDYYIGDNPKPPSDSDDPRPVPLLTATGEFTLALTGPLAWVLVAGKILRLALNEGGIGAKTSIGYGRMSVKADWLPEQKQTSGPSPKGDRRGEAGQSSQRKTLELRVDRFFVSPGQESRYATTNWRFDDGSQAEFVVARDVATPDIPFSKKTKHLGPALCELEYEGGTSWRVKKMRPVEE